jgi:hypothetical protein
MSWWGRLLGWRTRSSLYGREYRVAFTLYSKDGKRAVDVYDFGGGETYLNEKNWIEGTTYENRHSGKLVGPFASSEEAKRFIVTTPWFLGPDG